MIHLPEFVPTVVVPVSSASHRASTVAGLATFVRCPR